MEKQQDWKQGLNDRYIAQIIRRKMVTKTKPSKKIYNRNIHKCVHHFN